MDEMEEINNNEEVVVPQSNENSESQGQRSEFAAVVFQRIPETYPSDAHIECKYTITSDIVPTRSDWIGLYKVGWWTTRDYYYYEWAVIPEGYSSGTEAEASILFPSHKLPGDDGEFYQFCYVTSSGQIRGASTPFQFKRPSADDFVEVDDEEADMLVIRSKTVVLEENMHKLESDKQELVRIKQELENERDSLLSKLVSLEAQLAEHVQKNEQMDAHLKQQENYISQMTHEAKHMNLARDELQQRSARIKAEKSAIEDEVQKKEAEIEELKSQIRKLQGEKDCLAGENQTLREQMELYKSHFTTSEISSQEYQRQIEDLQVSSAKQESLVSQLKKEAQENKVALEKEKKCLERQKTVTKEDKQQMDDLKEKLRNTEDKLSAAEQVKIMLQLEITSHQETQQKLSREIEKTENEVHSLKHLINRMEEEEAKKSDLMKAEILSVQEDLKTAVEEKNRLQEERDELIQSKEQTEYSMSSLHCLKMAQANLKERYAKMEQSYHDLQAKYAKKKKDHKQATRDLIREIEDLKERLNMASTEYKNLYIEKKKVQKAYDRVMEKRRSSEGERRVSGTLPACSAVTEEKLLTSAAEAVTESCSTPGSLASSEVSITSQLQKGLDDMGDELAKMLQQKKKYKDLYKEEKSKLESLRRHFHDESKVKDTEIERLRKLVEEASSQHENKVRSLQNCVAERESTIDDLNRKLRDNLKIHDEPPSRVTEGERKEKEKPTSPLSPRTRGPPIPGMAYPVLMYSNPYHEEMTKMCSPPSTTTPVIVYPHSNTKDPQDRPIQTLPLAPLRYPDHKPLEPLRYPDHSTREVTTTKDDCKVTTRQPNGNPLSTDQLEVDCDPSVPLKPLPPPMEPERLASSKVLAVKSVLMDGDQNVSEFTVNFSGNRIVLEDDVTQPSAPPEERFEDAIGEAMKMCPICKESFSADVDPNIFDEHVLSHAGRICPVCHNMIEEVDDNGFQYHVNKHLEDATDGQE
ncbi:hypothetical protein FSP39_009914 [Pinctada imbricata]|uniref:UBZ1-type domain-containing protein n=1 Tax=Pinctada imbricata TaxID=66713 RepID=A0AA88YUQ0_PINIB|nr:hypothetical protein FSP39_009914 [Pinctada imbricata]